jgi:hypothetical protein
MIQVERKLLNSSLLHDFQFHHQCKPTKEVKPPPSLSFPSSLPHNPIALNTFSNGNYAEIVSGGKVAVLVTVKAWPLVFGGG